MHFSYIGKTYQQYIQDHPDERVRVIKPNMAITKDHQPGRVNLIVNGDDVIIKIYFEE